MLIALGVVVIIVTVFLLVKQYETRLVLFCAGMLLALCVPARSMPTAM